jgi:hypothetical protein
MADFFYPWNPIHIGDPGPEVYHMLTTLPPEQQLTIVQAIGEARVKLEATRSEGLALINEAVAASARQAEDQAL